MAHRITIAIFDTTGSVGERYAYSAYGAPVFMTGAGTVQTSSPVGFETLYAGYRWDNPAPQMYYVRNRFLLPQVGTWNKRDPLGYVDGISMYLCSNDNPIGMIDPRGERAQCTTIDHSTGLRVLNGRLTLRCTYFCRCTNAANQGVFPSIVPFDVPTVGPNVPTIGGNLVQALPVGWPEFESALCEENARDLEQDLDRDGFCRQDNGPTAPPTRPPVIEKPIPKKRVLRRKDPVFRPRTEPKPTPHLHPIKINPIDVVVPVSVGAGVGIAVKTGVVEKLTEGCSRFFNSACRCGSMIFFMIDPAGRYSGQPIDAGPS